MDYVWIDKESAPVFDEVLPEEFAEGAGRVAIGAVDERDRILGAMCYRYADYRYDVLWLYVGQSARRKGVATGLLDKLFEIASVSGEILPISALFEAAEGEALYPFFLSYEKMEVSFSHNRFYISSRKLRRAKLPKVGQKEILKQERFLSLPETGQKRILARLLAEENYVSGDYREFSKTLVPELSKVVLKDGEPLALIFVQRTPSGDLELSYLYSQSPAALAELLTYTAWDAEEYYPEAALFFDTVNENAESIASKIFPEAEPVPVYEAEW